MTSDAQTLRYDERLWVPLWWWGAAAVVTVVLGYEIRLETALEHDDGKFLWYHPRAAAVPIPRAPAAA